MLSRKDPSEVCPLSGEKHSLYLTRYRLAFASSDIPYLHAHRLPLRVGFSNLGEGVQAYPVSLLYLSGLGPAYFAGGAPFATEEVLASVPGHLPFG